MEFVKKENTILVLEDEESVSRGITFSLSRAGYEVLDAGTIAEAGELLVRRKPQLLICDINLPDGSGLEFVRKARRESGAYIICLTVLDQEVDQVLGYEAGADDYMVKPFSLSVLLLKVAAYFKRRGSEGGEVLGSGELSFDLRERRISKSGEEITLTPNEWKFLQMFLEHPKQILSKGQLQQKLFDIDGNFVDDNTIAVNIRRLREKIENDASQPEYIKNIRGIGYVWAKECEVL